MDELSANYPLNVLRTFTKLVETSAERDRNVRQGCKKGPPNVTETLAFAKLPRNMDETSAESAQSFGKTSEMSAKYPRNVFCTFAKLARDVGETGSERLQNLLETSATPARNVREMYSNRPRNAYYTLSKHLCKVCKERPRNVTVMLAERA